MADTTEPGRTGRGGRRGGEAPPPDRAPDEEPALGEEEAEIGSSGGLYFTKAPLKEIWFAYDEDDNPLGRVHKDASGWRARIGKEDAPTVFGSAPSARAFLGGYHYAMTHRGAGPGQPTRPAAVVDAGGALQTRPDGGFDASAAEPITG